MYNKALKIHEEVITIDTHCDIDLKISLYKRIALVTTNKEKEDIMIEMIDRFGKLPKEVENLFKLIEIKILCFQQNIENIDFGTNGLLISFFQNKPNNPEKLMELNLNIKNSKIKIRPDNKVFYYFDDVIDEDKFNIIKNIVKLIS